LWLFCRIEFHHRAGNKKKMPRSIWGKTIFWWRRGRGELPVQKSALQWERVGFVLPRRNSTHPTSSDGERVGQSEEYRRPFAEAQGDIWINRLNPPCPLYKRGNYGFPLAREWYLGHKILCPYADWAREHRPYVIHQGRLFDSQSALAVIRSRRRQLRLSRAKVLGTIPVYKGASPQHR